MTTGIIVILSIAVALLAWLLWAALQRSNKLKQDRNGLLTALESETARSAERLARFKAEEEARIAVERAHSVSSHARAQQAKELRELRRSRGLAWPKPEGRMAPAAVIAEFNVDMKDGLWGAVMQELDDAIGEQLDLVTQAPSAQLTAEMRTHAGGMAEGLRVFQRRLLDLQKKATAAEADEDAGNE